MPTGKSQGKHVFELGATHWLSSKSKLNDIAVLELASPFIFDKNVEPIVIGRDGFNPSMRPGE